MKIIFVGKTLEPLRKILSRNTDNEIYFMYSKDSEKVMKDLEKEFGEFKNKEMIDGYSFKDTFEKVHRKTHNRKAITIDITGASKISTIAIMLLSSITSKKIYLEYLVRDELILIPTMGSNDKQEVLFVEMIEKHKKYRYKILEALSKGIEKVTEIAKSVDTSKQNVEYNLKKLVEDKLVEKGENHTYRLTRLGKDIFELIKFLNEKGI